MKKQLILFMALLAFILMGPVSGKRGPTGTSFPTNLAGPVDMNGYAIQDGGRVWLNEQDGPGTDVASQGQLWISDSDSFSLVYTDKNEVDYELNNPAGTAQETELEM
jgi:hypothetical protein